MEGIWNQCVIVQSGGRVEVVVPDLREGEQVQIEVRRNGESRDAGKRRGYGSARGEIEMTDDFDAPLDDFREYM